jgi:hypothetical protein
MASSNNKKLRKVTRKKLTPRVIPVGANQNDPLQFLTNVVGTFNTNTTDGSGYGALPAAERNNTYFAYFNDVTSTEPEILDKSGIYIKYLIDKNGELTDPKPGDVALYNLRDTFEKDTKLFISPEQASQAYSPLIGSHSIENVGTVQLVMTSEYGTGASDMLSSIRFSQYVNSKLAQAVVTFEKNRSVFSSSAVLPSADDSYYYWDMGHPDTNWESVIKFASGSLRNTNVFAGGPYTDPSSGALRGWNNTWPVDNTGSNLVDFDPTTGEYDILGDPRDYNLNLYIEFFGTVGVAGPPNTGFTFQLAVQRSIDNGVSWTNVSPQGGGFNSWYRGYQQGPTLNNISAQYGTDACVTFNGTTDASGTGIVSMGYICAPQTAVDPSYKYRLAYRVIDISNPNQWYWFLQYAPTYGSNFKLGQDYSYNLTATRTNNTNYWLTGSFPTDPTKELLWLTASNKSISAGQFGPLAEFTNPFDGSAVGAGYVQVFTNNRQEILDLGFTQANISAVPQKGDYIRFEYDKNKQARILDIRPISTINGNTYAIGIWPNDLFSPSTVYDHFTISRVIDDGNYIIINKFYPASGSVVGELTGFARPENLTQEIQDNFGNLTTQLVKDGVLNK